MKHSWTILIRYGSQRKKYKVTGQEGESAVNLFSKVKEVVAKIRPQIPESATIDVYCNSKSFAPKKDAEHPRGMLWCPQCIKYRNFFDDDRLGCRRCSICGISDNDFAVKKYNLIFAIEMAHSRGMSVKSQDLLRKRLTRDKA